MSLITRENVCGLFVLCLFLSLIHTHTHTQQEDLIQFFPQKETRGCFPVQAGESGFHSPTPTGLWLQIIKLRSCQSKNYLLKLLKLYKEVSYNYLMICYSNWQTKTVTMSWGIPLQSNKCWPRMTLTFMSMKC